MPRPKGSKDSFKEYKEIEGVCVGCGENFNRKTMCKTSQFIKYCSDSCQRRTRHLKSRYNITFEDVDKLLDQQNNLCAICDVDLNSLTQWEINIDHNHETNKIRGILCNSCNLGLGNFKDNINNLNKAIKYLENN